MFVQDTPQVGIAHACLRMEIAKPFTTLQEDMYSYVTVADDQQFKGKNTEVVDA